MSSLKLTGVFSFNDELTLHPRERLKRALDLCLI